MGPDAKKLLRDIGLLLDLNRHEDICIYRSGIVRPCVTGAESFTHAKEAENEQQGPSRPPTQQGPSRPPTESWPRPSGQQRQTGRSRAPLQVAQVISRELAIAYDAELEAVSDAFPNTQVWRRTEGLWLVTESLLLPGIWQKAKFITWVPHSRTSSLVRGWGFWDGKMLRRPLWIGPRHTNYDGSICAFEPKDKTWVPGEGIVDLLRYYTFWAIRHLHLQIFGRWPGYQVVHTPWERLLEVKVSEYCGCERFDQRYSDCCFANDLNEMKNNKDMVYALVRRERRRPPSEIEGFVTGRSGLPDDDILSSLFFREYAKRDFIISEILNEDFMY